MMMIIKAQRIRITKLKILQNKETQRKMRRPRDLEDKMGEPSFKRLEAMGVMKWNERINMNKWRKVAEEVKKAWNPLYR